MTSLFDRLNVYSTLTETQSFSDEDYSKRETIAKYHKEININLDEFAKKLSSNIIAVLETNMNSYVDEHCGIMGYGGSFSLFCTVVTNKIRHHFNFKLVDRIYNINQYIKPTTITALIKQVIIFEDLNTSTFFTVFSNKIETIMSYMYDGCYYENKYTADTTPLPLCVNLLGKLARLQRDQNKLQAINKFIKTLITQDLRALRLHHLTTNKLINIIQIVKNPNNIPHISTFISYLKYFRDEDKYYENIKKIYNNLVSTSSYNNDPSHQIEYCNIMQLILMSNNTLTPTNMLHHYQHLLDYGFNDKYTQIYKNMYVEFGQYIISNWDIYEKYELVIDKYLSIMDKNNVYIPKIKNMKYSQNFNKDFQNMTVNFQDENHMDFSQQKCKIEVVCSDVDHVYPLLTFMPELQVYVSAMRNFNAQKCDRLPNTILYGKTIVTVNIEDKWRITGNILTINVLLAINTFKHPLIQLVIQILSHSIFINELTNLIRCGFVRKVNNVLSFYHLTNNTIINFDEM